MKSMYKQFPYADYGNKFKAWLESIDTSPYYSYGNGAPMRCSAAGWAASSAKQAYLLGAETAMVSHNHPSAIKASGMLAQLIFLARTGKTMIQLKSLAD